jgi:hypothetical protein
MMSFLQHATSQRVVNQGDAFAVHIVTRNGIRIVPGFPTAQDADRWIEIERDFAQPFRTLRPTAPTFSMSTLFERVRAHFTE